MTIESEVRGKIVVAAREEAPWSPSKCYKFMRQYIDPTFRFQKAVVEGKDELTVYRIHPKKGEQELIRVQGKEKALPFVAMEALMHIMGQVDTIVEGKTVRFQARKLTPPTIPTEATPIPAAEPVKEETNAQ